MGFFDWLKPSPLLDAATQARIGQAVQAVDPLIGQVSQHARILAPAVQHAWRYCETLASAIPGPFAISRSAFADNPLVHALFGSADDVDIMLATSECIREHLVEMTLNDDHCCALLGMRPKITAGFGVRISGELISRDEPQKTLTFADHTLAEPSPDLDTAHRRLTERMFEGLLKIFVAHVDSVREERQELRDAATLARAQARSSGPEAHMRRLDELQTRLRATADTLQPDRLVHTLATHLAAPETSLQLSPLKLWVDRFGVLAEGDDHAHADALRFVELTTRDQRRWVVMVVKISRDEARAAFAHLEARRRYIVI